jgi:soluble lytic murein transglycosylase-like protein
MAAHALKVALQLALETTNAGAPNKVKAEVISLAEATKARFGEANKAVQTSLGSLETAYKSLGIRSRETIQAELHGIQASIQQFQSAKLPLQEIERVTVSARQQIARLHQELRATAAAPKPAAPTPSRTGSAFAGGLVGGVVGSQLNLGSVFFPISAAVEFEDKLYDVKKVVDELKTPAALQTFGQQIQAMAERLPIAAAGLLEIAAAGGQANVKLAELPGYIEQVAQVAVAFQMLPGEAGKALNAMAAQLQRPVSGLRDLTDAINYTANNANSSEREIVGVLQRILATGQAARLSERDMVALASTFLSFGKTEETTATAIAALINRLHALGAQSPQTQKAFQALGYDTKQLQQAFDAQPTTTILDFFERVAKGGEQLGLVFAKLGLDAVNYQEQIAAAPALVAQRLAALLRDKDQITLALLSSMRIDPAQLAADLTKDGVAAIQAMIPKLKQEARIRGGDILSEAIGTEFSDDLAMLLTAGAELRRQLALSVAPQAAGATAAEFATQLEKTSSKLKIAQNSFENAVVKWSTSLLPALQQAASGVSTVMQRIGELSQAMGGLRTLMPGVAGAITGAIYGPAIAAAFTRAGVGIAGLRTAFMAFTSLLRTTAWGLVFAGLFMALDKLLSKFMSAQSAADELINRIRMRTGQGDTIELEAARQDRDQIAKLIQDEQTRLATLRAEAADFETLQQANRFIQPADAPEIDRARQAQREQIAAAEQRINSYLEDQQRNLAKIAGLEQVIAALKAAPAAGGAPPAPARAPAPRPGPPTLTPEQHQSEQRLLEQIKVDQRATTERAFREQSRAARVAARDDWLIQAIEQIARHVGIEPTLLRAVVTVESAGNAGAVSPKGAIGLGQLMPATAERFGVNPADPTENLLGAAKYLKFLLDKFGSLELALAGYNAGEGAVERAGNRIPPFAETQAYVPKVLARLDELAGDRGLGRSLQADDWRRQGQTEVAQALGRLDQSLDEAARDRESTEQDLQQVLLRLLEAIGANDEAFAIRQQQEFGPLLDRARQFGLPTAPIQQAIHVEQVQFQFEQAAQGFTDALERLRDLADRGLANQGLGRTPEWQTAAAEAQQQLSGMQALAGAGTGAQGQRMQQALIRYQAQLTGNLNEGLLMVGQTVEGPLMQALTSLATRAQSASEVLTTMAQSVAQALAQMAAQMLVREGGSAAAGWLKTGLLAIANYYTGGAAGAASAAGSSAAGSSAAGSAAAGSAGAGSAAAGSAGTFGFSSAHRGGVVGPPGTPIGGNPLRHVALVNIAAAPRYHDGGLAGNEVLTVLQRGEEVLPASHPRHRDNLGKAGEAAPAAPGMRVILLDDNRHVGDWMESSSGEQVILKVLQRRRGQVREILAR